MILTNGINLRVSATGRLLGSGAATNLYWLFTNSEIGGYIDLAPIYPHQSLFTDVAGTTPVTAPGQTVALARLKPYGVDFTQASASLRPTYAVRPKGGRKNLLTYTEQFDNAVWTKVDVSVSSNAVVAPDGTLTADKLIPSVSNVSDHAISIPVSVTTGSPSYTATIYAKADGYNFVFIRGFGLGGAGGARFNVSTGTLVGVAGYVSASITSVGGGWYRCSATGVPTTQSWFVNVSNTDTIAAFAGDGTSGVYVWGAQINLGATPTPYQRVTTIYDVYEAGKEHYGALWFDGVDDFMVSGTVTPGTDKVQVFAGVRKNSDAVDGVLIESSSTSSGANPGSIAVFAPTGSGTIGFSFRSRGSLNPVIATTSSAFPFGNSYVMVNDGDISSDKMVLRINGSVAGSSVLDQGTGNYLAYPIYLGRRAGTSIPFNGEIEALIGYRFGPNLSDTQLSQISNFINSRTGAF